VPDVMAQDNAEELLNDVYIADNEVILRAAEQTAAQGEPDAVVYDVFHFTAGKLLATKLDRPDVRLSGIFAANEKYSIWEDLRQSLGRGTRRSSRRPAESSPPSSRRPGIDRPHPAVLG
jgi:hypothetical protein